MYDDIGRHIGEIGISRDITERMRAELLLRESEARNRLLATIVNQTHEAIIATDLAGMIVIWNAGAQRMFGHGAGESVGRNAHELLDAEWSADRMQVALARMREQRTATWEAPRRTRDGRTLTVEVSVSPMYDETGKHVGEISVCRDITERMQAQASIRQLNLELEQRVRERTAELQTSNEELESFSYSIAHDLRAPLRAMDGYSVMLLEDCAVRLDERAIGYLRRIRSGSQHMAELIEAMLELARTTRAQMYRERVDLSLLALQVERQLRQADPDRAATVQVAPGLAATGDSKLLRVALENLIGNAWKFTSKNPAARIEFARAADDGSMNTFVVRDNGAGFDMAYAGKLFNAFQRLHHAGEFPGTGIGLATVKRIVERHGGHIWAESGPGRGADFHFTLPAA
jgi:PAS domain S-box-containing protein